MKTREQRQAEFERFNLWLEAHPVGTWLVSLALAIVLCGLSLIFERAFGAFAGE